MSKWIQCSLVVGLMVFGISSAEAAKKGDKPKHARGEMFSKLDTNSDKKISLDEFKAFKPRAGKTGKNGKEFDAEKVFKHKDKNNDGFLTADEFKHEGSKKKS